MANDRSRAVEVVQRAARGHLGTDSGQDIPSLIPDPPTPLSDHDVLKRPVSRIAMQDPTGMTKTEAAAPFIATHRIGAGSDPRASDPHDSRFGDHWGTARASPRAKEAPDSGNRGQHGSPGIRKFGGRQLSMHLLVVAQWRSRWCIMENSSELTATPHDSRHIAPCFIRLAEEDGQILPSCLC